MNNDYLVHYGVLGMKWGVRRDPQKAFSKAQKKYSRIRERSTAIRLKAEKKEAKLYSKRLPRDSKRFYKKYRNINMMKVRASKLTKRGDKWLSQMDKVFANVII